MRARHKDEQELSLATTLSPTEFIELLQYVQDLRNVTDGVTDPVAWLATPAWPTKPTWI